ncbi:protein of unknown function [Nitrosomonas sp. Nm51]|uniref:DUF1841 family protein n=1 Tax=Nitrosomonas sp. Nm51 TaxID=133720 RepID=UPI0008B212D1|nr:DUF1841 family protein [Nitrosomonas sp. Nm51]SER09837.1 protein of unknown function [Nitrosomonas sp. Nm51]
MFKPTRNQARQFFFDAWRKYRQQEVLSGIEQIALEIILLHPEYHDMLEDEEHCRDKDYLPEMGETNPFLHLSLHVAIKEQLSINQPAGINACFLRLRQQVGNEHDAAHQVMECLADMLWQAQRNQTAPDELIYLDCLDKRLAKLKKK